MSYAPLKKAKRVHTKYNLYVYPFKKAYGGKLPNHTSNTNYRVCANVGGKIVTVVYTKTLAQANRIAGIIKAVRKQDLKQFGSVL
jgi:hypothetical protein